MSLQQLAQKVRSRGRGDDTELVHLTRGEVDGLHALARSIGHKRGLSVNPDTGLHEAGALKKFLPSIIGGVVGAYTGSPEWGAAAGALTGAAANKDDRLTGALTGGIGGYGAAQIGSAIQGAGGLSALGTSEGLKKLWGTAGTPANAKTGADAVAATGLGGAGGAFSAGLKAAAPYLAAAPEGDEGGGDQPYSISRDPNALRNRPRRLKRTYLGGVQTPGAAETAQREWFKDEYVPSGAGGGLVSLAKGGSPLDSSTANKYLHGNSGKSKEAYDYLWGRGALTREVPDVQKLSFKPREVTAPGADRGSEPLTSGTSGGVPGGIDRAPVDFPTGPIRDMGENTDIDIRGGNQEGYGGSNWEDPDGTGPSGEMNAADIAMMELGDTMAELKAEYPNAAKAGEWIIDAATGLPIMKIVDWLQQRATNKSLTNPRSGNYQNEMDKESDAARQAAADAAEIERLKARAAAGAGGSTPSEMPDVGGGEEPSGETPIGDRGPVEMPDYGEYGSGGDYGGNGDFGGDYSGGDGGEWGGSDSGADWGDWGGGSSSPGGGGSGGWYWNEAYDKGGIVSLQSGGFVFPADVVAAVGAGSSNAGMEALAERFGAVPVSGGGHGQSDDIEATIDGRQPARVARDEMVLDADQVAGIGGGDPEKGAKKLYDFMKSVRKQSMGTARQMRPVDISKAAGGGIPKLMRKRGYADGGTTSTQIVSNIPAYAEESYRDLVGAAEDLAYPKDGAESTRYTGERVAQFSPLQQQGLTDISNLKPSAYTGEAGGIAGLAAQKALGTSYTPGTFGTYGGGPQQVSTQSFTAPGTANAYMNPYQQGVTDIAKREATRADDIARTGRNAQAVGAGAFGGSRQAIVEAEAGRNLGQRLNDIQMTGSDAAFRNAQGQFNTEQGLGLQAQQANQGANLQFGNQYLDAQKLGEQSRQYGGNLGLQGLQTAMTGASTLGGIGSDQFKQDLQTGVTKTTAGAGEQEQAQKIFDQQYGDYQEQKEEPYKKLGFMSDILRGTQGTTRTMFDKPAAPTGLQSLAGLATTLYGAQKSGMFGSAKGGIVKLAEGGTADTLEGMMWPTAPIKMGQRLLRLGSTDTEDIADRLGFQLDPNKRSYWGDVGVRTAGLADDLAMRVPSTLLGPGGKKKEAAPYSNERDRRPKDGGVDTPPIEPTAARGSGIAALGGERISAGPAPTLDQLRKERAAGVSYGPLKQEGIASLNEIAAARRAASEQSEKELDEMYAKQGVAGAEREKKLQARIDEMGGRGERAKGDALIQAGLGMLMAKPGGAGWRGALAPIAAGLKGGLDQFREEEGKLRVEKSRLDDSMDAVLEARRLEENAKGKEKLALRQERTKLEVDAKEKMGSFLQSIGLEEVKTDKATLDAYWKQYGDWKTHDLQAKIHNADNARHLGIANLMYGTAAGGGGKPMTAAQRATAINGLTDDIMKSPEGRMMSVPQARAMAERLLSGQAPAASGVSMTVTP